MSLYSSKISICLAFLKTAFEKKLDKRCSCEYIKCRSIDGHLPFTKYFGYTRILYYTYIIHNIHHSSDGNGKSFGYMPRRWKNCHHTKYSFASAIRYTCGSRLNRFEYLFCLAETYFSPPNRPTLNQTNWQNLSVSFFSLTLFCPFAFRQAHH